ncbi:beta-1,3-galactosyltransferase 1-like [Sphaeramia orbicularis]|uniref:Hexosyltransferase n=1 Tax=Sphaeramia orbicularis TaxID=375764 RepID=A0A673BWB2_9TELE|nr:beta-1,3-galactosyltransferase 1-like [Sphaeramia orbicularis]
MKLPDRPRLLSVFTRYVWRKTVRQQQGREDKDTAKDWDTKSLEMEDDGKSLDSRACCSRRRILFFLLLFVCGLFFYVTDFSAVAPYWSPHWSLESNGSTPWPSPVAHKPVYLNLTVAQTAALNTHRPTKMADIRSSTTGTPYPSSETQQNPGGPAVPYVSPGPYLVEYPAQYHFIINEPVRCQDLRPFLVLMVPVAPNNRKHRDAIRRTWGGQTMVLDKAVALFFILGRQTGVQLEDQLLQESRDHRDLIQADFLDCYKNLTIKTMVMMEWLDAHCSGASYAMKIDSDMFLNVAKLVSMLTDAPRTAYLSGLVERAAGVLRQRSSKWFVPVQVYPRAAYPPYALGLGYVFSMDLPRKLVAASRHVKALYIEDVYVGMCMEHLGIPLTNPPQGGYFHVFPVMYSRCAYANLIATTLQEHDDLVTIWTDFERPGSKC